MFVIHMILLEKRARFELGRNLPFSVLGIQVDQWNADGYWF